MTVCVSPRLEMITHEYRIEPHLVGDNREAQKVCGPELLRGCLVA
jgi:hypothetical protein